jgi:hypothetical protein
LQDEEWVGSAGHDAHRQVLWWVWKVSLSGDDDRLPTFYQSVLGYRGGS